MDWALPTALKVGGENRRINADYRVALEIISRLTDPEQDFYIKTYVCLALFYPEFEDLPDTDYQDAIDQMLWFMAPEETDDAPKAPKLIDWEQDYWMIVSDINKIAGHDVRADRFCHWWTFLAYFAGIGEGQLSTVVSIRDKLKRGKKLEKWERDYYRVNRSKVDFRRRYTQEEEEFIRQVTGR